MFTNLYPLSNMGFINLGRAQFLCDLITGIPINICAHIFQTIGKIATRMWLPFCSLLMKIMKHEGVRPPKDGKIIVHHHPISIASLQKSKSHSSAERKKQNLSTPPKGESGQHVTHSGYGLTAHTTETTSSHIPAPPTRSEEHSSCVISSQELWLTFVLISSRLLEKQQHECTFPSAVFSWKSWNMKVFVHQKMKRS